jgi:hypothetical protein
VVVAVSSTTHVRPGAPARPAFTAGEPQRVRAPRPWAAPLPKPAARILLAGGLTLAGWLLGAALTGSTASAAETATCPAGAPVVSTVEHDRPAHGHHHRRHHHDTGVGTGAQQPGIAEAHWPTGRADERQSGEAPATDERTGDTQTDAPPGTATEDPAAEKQTDAPAAAADQPGKSPAAEKQTSETPSGTSSATEHQTGDTPSGESPAAEVQAENTPVLQLHTMLAQVAEPQVTKPPVSTSTSSAVVKPAGSTVKPSSGAGLLGGLVGGVLEVVGGTLNTVTSTVNALAATLTHTILAPLTQPSTSHPTTPVLLPLDDILSPVLDGGAGPADVTATVPGVVTAVAAPVTGDAGTEAAAVPATATTTTTQTTRFAVVRLVERQHSLPAAPEQPRDSGVHARDGGGGRSNPGLPGGTTAPSAPATSAVPGHDGPGGARQQFAVHTDDVTTTQLKLIGTSLDHEVDGAGREAALPTTSPD